MSETNKPPKRSYENTSQRQSEAIEAVIHLCAEHDPSTLTTTRIAKEIGLSQGALFKHFPTKGRLLEAVASWVSGQLTRRVFHCAGPSEQADAALETMFMAHIRFIAQYPGIPRLMLGELQKPGNHSAKIIIQKTMANYRHQIVELLNKGIQQKQFASDIDVEAGAVLYLGAIQGLVIQGIMSGNSNNIEDIASRIFRLYSAGLQDNRNGH